MYQCHKHYHPNQMWSALATWWHISNGVQGLTNFNCKILYKKLNNTNLSFSWTWSCCCCWQPLSCFFSYNDKTVFQSSQTLQALSLHLQAPYKTGRQNQNKQHYFTQPAASITVIAEVHKPVLQIGVEMPYLNILHTNTTEQQNIKKHTLNKAII